MPTASVVFAADRQYVPHLATALTSLLRNNPDWDVEISVLNTDIDSDTWQRLETISNRDCHRLVNAKISASQLEGLPLRHHFTVANYYRLFIPEAVASDRALYLDSDVIVRGSLETMYSTPLDGYLLAAVENPGFDRHIELEMNPASKAFNSGVMLLNLPEWRQLGMKDRVLQFVRRKPQVIQFVDQCGLNSVVDGRWKALHPRFNVQSAFFDMDDQEADGIFEPGAVRSSLADPVVVHYTGSSKPWQSSSTHPYRSLYWQYRRQTPYRRLTADDTTILTMARRLVPRRIRSYVRGLMSQH